MNRKKRERLLKYSRQYYYENRDDILRKQECYRYAKSVQRVVDDNWYRLFDYDDKKLQGFAVKMDMFGSARKLFAFKKAIVRNRQEGIDVVNQRIADMKLFQKNIGKKKNGNRTN